jgi:hypothetical protein
VALTFGLGMAGCDAERPLPPAPKTAPTIGPHQGTAFVLPHESGLVELVNEPEPEGRGQAVATSVVAYFLAPDARTPLAPPPTHVRVQINQGARKRSALELNADPRPSDPSGASRFASRTGPFPLSELHGVLTGSLGGSDFRVPLAEVR